MDARPGKSNSSPCTGWAINEYKIGHKLSRDTRFPTMWYVRPAKVQTSLRIRADWSRPLLLAWIFYDCQPTDWTAFGVSKLKRRLHRLVWVSTCHFDGNRMSWLKYQRILDSLNEGLPIKVARKMFQRKR